MLYLCRNFGASCNTDLSTVETTLVTKERRIICYIITWHWTEYKGRSLRQADPPDFDKAVPQHPYHHLSIAVLLVVQNKVFLAVMCAKL